jgi:hypothetical protein
MAKQAGERIRRATGTRTPLDALRASLRLLRRTPEGDIEALMNGETLRVAAVRVGSGERRFGDLLLGLQRDPSIVWISRRGDRLPIAPPIEVQEVRRTRKERVAKDLYHVVIFTAADQPWQLAVPIQDVALIQRAFREVGSRR